MMLYLSFQYVLLQVALQSTIQDILINELNSDSPSSDNEEFVELWNPESCPLVLDGYNLVFFNGFVNPAAVYRTVNLSGNCIDGDGYLLIGSPNVIPTPDIIPFTSNGIQNGLSNADAIALYKNDRVPSTPTRTDLVDAMIYDKEPITQAGGFFPELMDTETVLYENENARGGEESLSRCSVTPLKLASFTIGIPTPGTTNFCGPIKQNSLAYSCDIGLFNNDGPVELLQDSRFEYRRNTAVQGTPILSLNSRSSIECAAECSKRKACFRFSYLKNGIDKYNCVLFPVCDITFNPSPDWRVGEKL